ncbi:MAG: TolB family protein [Phycisphaerae bacterium]
MSSRAAANWIVFSSNRGGSWAIWKVRPDGTGLAQVTKPGEGEQDVDPCLDKDGSNIIFTSTRGGSAKGAGVWRMAADGSNPKRICDGDQAEWSPDGKKIVFRRAGRLLTRDLASGAEKTISPAVHDKCSGPAWRPDGSMIAYALLGGDGNAIYTVPAGGGQATKVYDKQGACEPHWSPSGASILYETESHLCTINPDGTKNKMITYYGGVQRYGRYSPDGTKIIFCQAPSPDGPYELYIVPADGGSPTKLTEGGSDMYPDWR